MICHEITLPQNRKQCIPGSLGKLCAMCMPTNDSSENMLSKTVCVCICGKTNYATHEHKLTPHFAKRVEKKTVTLNRSKQMTTASTKANVYLFMTVLRRNIKLHSNLALRFLALLYMYVRMVSMAAKQERLSLQFSHQTISRCRVHSINDAHDHHDDTLILIANNAYSQSYLEIELYSLWLERKKTPRYAPQERLDCLNSSRM